MTEHRSSYPALADDGIYRAIGEMERSLDNNPRYVVMAERIPQVVDRIETGDVLAFATSTPGIDVSHAAYAYRGSDGILRVLHAPLSGGAVAITHTTLPEYVSAIRHATVGTSVTGLPELCIFASVVLTLVFRPQGLFGRARVL